MERGVGGRGKSPLFHRERGLGGERKEKGRINIIKTFIMKHRSRGEWGREERKKRKKIK